jgi:hypothetical protein
MAYYRISSRTGGTDLGIYEGETTEEALGALARAAGYEDHAAACEVTGEDGSDLIVERLEEDQGLLAMAIQAAGYQDSARGFAIEVCDVDERTVRKWIAGDRGIDGLTRQFFRAIIAHPEIVKTIQIPRERG